MNPFPAPAKKKRRYPVSSFGPAMMAALKKGAVEKVVLKFPNLKSATFFHHRLHLLRAAMREENHSESALVSRARATKEWGEKLGPAFADDVRGLRACHIVIQPNDDQFNSVLEEAGIDVKPPQIKLNETEEEALAPLINEPGETLPMDPYANFKGGDK